MQEAAEKRYSWSRAEQDDEENADTHPGIDTEIKAGVGKRESGAGKCGKNVAKSIGSR
jgi:hypothetical protein